jgi:hypothetical protein
MQWESGDVLTEHRHCGCTSTRVAVVEAFLEQLQSVVDLERRDLNLRLDVVVRLLAYSRRLVPRSWQCMVIVGKGGNVSQSVSLSSSFKYRRPPSPL